MSLRINTNIASLNAQKNLSKNEAALSKSFEKLASGERINRASDDAAGLAISENLRAQVKGLEQAKRNSNDGISLIQTAEGGLNEISSILIRLRELGVQAASDTIGETERGFLNVEFKQLVEEVSRIAESTVYNGTKLLNGEGGNIDVQIGIHSGEQDRFTYDASDINASADSLGVSGLSIEDKSSAQSVLGDIDTALKNVSTYRATLGALQSRMNSAIHNIENFHENIVAADSRIRDVDVAQETAELTKSTIKQQAATAVLAQSNQAPSIALKLIG